MKKKPVVKKSKGGLPGPAITRAKTPSIDQPAVSTGFKDMNLMGVNPLTNQFDSNEVNAIRSQKLMSGVTPTGSSLPGSDAK